MGDRWHRFHTHRRLRVCARANTVYVIVRPVYAPDHQPGWAGGAQVTARGDTSESSEPGSSKSEFFTPCFVKNVPSRV